MILFLLLGIASLNEIFNSIAMVSRVKVVSMRNPMVDAVTFLDLMEEVGGGERISINRILNASLTVFVFC